MAAKGPIPTGVIPADAVDAEVERVLAALADAIAARGFSHGEVAAGLGVTPTTFSRLMLGKTHLQFGHLLSIARALDEEPARLVGELYGYRPSRWVEASVVPAFRGLGELLVARGHLSHEQLLSAVLDLCAEHDL